MPLTAAQSAAHRKRCYERDKLHHAEVRYRNALKRAGRPFPTAAPTDWSSLLHLSVVRFEWIPRPYDTSGQEFWVVVRGQVMEDGGPLCVATFPTVSQAGLRTRMLNAQFRKLQKMLPAHFSGFVLDRAAAQVFPN